MKMHFRCTALRVAWLAIFLLVIPGLMLTQKLPFVASVSAQETTGGLQGTVKDPSGAVVPNVKVVVTGTSLVGSKEAETDSSGYYRFANLPPGTYTIMVTAKGFRTVKREGLNLEVGHLPTVDLLLEVGSSETIVEVSGAAPVIDVTTTHTLTNITSEIIQNIPHGTSYQSMIQFAPSARNEPLAGATPGVPSGTGGCSPTGCSSGNSAGYSVGGAADSENAYLVEGQETANVIGGYSHTNVPFDFIDQVEMKSSGIEAEHGGAMGGVVNVIMKKGGNAFHGSVYAQYESDKLDGAPNAGSRYNPLDAGSIGAWGGNIDPAYQNYQPKKDGFSVFVPGFTLGGPIQKDRIWFLFGFNPELISRNRAVDFGGTTGAQLFTQDRQTYYTTARIDANVSKKVRVFASWLYQYQREAGQSLPQADSATGMYNPSSSVPLFAFAHAIGYAAPNATTNLGADFTVTPRLIATTRFGYFFENYHDFGYPGGSTTYFWLGNGVGQSDINDNALPQNLQQPNGYYTAANNINTTVRNANKHLQFDQDLAWYKSGWGGTHNFKFGYQLNRLSNDIYQHWNQPAVQIFPGNTQFFSAGGATGYANCAALVATYGVAYGDPLGSNCTGTYGYVNVEDYGSKGKVTSYNHAFFLQDAWTLGKGITINAGFRLEKEYLPSETTAGGFPSTPIQFGWGDKFAPRIGAAWDVFRNGKMKIFGGYGVFNDIMKLNLAISSFGGQYWQNCNYALMTANYTTIIPAYDSAGYYCTGSSSTEATFQSGSTPAGLIFLENQNYRGTEGVMKGLKPYRQHESVIGVDYKLGKDLALEARWDRRRLDHIIEDTALFDASGSEVFTIVNPGEGPNATNTTCDAKAVPAVTPVCPPNIKAERSYDGFELRLNKSLSNHWFGMFSYTYSRLYGNYAGLTSTDLADAGGGRNSPNNSRSFDESYFQYNANGGSSSGPLGTDRPHAFKGYAYYEKSWNSRNTTDVGIYQFAYSGSPMSSYQDVGYWFGGGAFPVYVEGRGNWVDVSQDPVTGLITAGTAYSRRTPWFTQTDFNISHQFKVAEGKSVKFTANFTNLLNQHTVTAYNSQIDSANFPSAINPGGVPFYVGGVAYSAYEHAYDWRSLLNTDGVTLNSQYGKPYLYQSRRSIRMQLTFIF